MKKFFRLLFFYFLIFIIFSFFYLVSFHSQMFLSQKVLFYRGIMLLPIAFFPTLFLSILLAKLLKFGYEIIFSSLVLVLSIHVCFFVLFPVTYDRSITMYILNSINNNNKKNYSCHGLTKKELQDKLINDYIIKKDAINKRLVEQTIINNIFLKDECIDLTNSGIGFLNLSKLIMYLYGLK